MSNEQPISRRGFLTSTAAAAAGALAATSIASAADAPTTAGTTKPSTRGAGGGGRRREPKPMAATTQTKYSQIRVAAIGVGGRGWNDLNEIVKLGANVVALCDVDSQRLERASAGLPNAKTYSDFRQLFDKEANNIDAVIVAT